MDSIAGELAFMASSAGRAFVILMDWHRLIYLGAGCMMGLVLGIIPGIGGLAGTAMLLPFTFNMDPYTAFALLLGLGSTTATGDPIPAILFGVPGGAASAATVLDGFPMAKNGEAGRALSAAYMSSLMGGVFGAFLMGISIPILRPVMLFLGSPELLAFSVLGISMVAVLSGSAPLRGLTAGCLGIMIAMIGTDPQSGTLRWTFDSLYLWDGLPLTPLLLGVFALPELCDLLISRTAIAADTSIGNIYKGQIQGMKDCLKHWWLILRCSWIGGGIGSIPGISASVVDWLAYGHALKTEKGANQTFGKGDVRGVIASESANNAKEGGALLPTVAFGVPGSATMAILLGAFLIHGLVPGPDMLHKNLDITYAMVWSIALANILGAGMCYAFSPQFAKLSVVRFSLILPAVLGIIYIGAFEATRQWGDLYSLLAFGLLGWIMKQFKWPRPPLILGVVLGDTIERYLFISVERYGLTWLDRPVVAILLTIAVIGLVRPFLQDIRIHGRTRLQAAIAREPLTTGGLVWSAAVARLALITTPGLIVADFVAWLLTRMGANFESAILMKIVVSCVIAGPLLIWWLRKRNISRDNTVILAVIVALALAQLSTNFVMFAAPVPVTASLLLVGIAIAFSKSIIVGLVLVLWLGREQITRENVIADANAYLDRFAAEWNVLTNGLRRMVTEIQAPTFHPSQLFTMFIIALLAAACLMALRWDFSAKIVPLVIGTVALTAAGLSLLNDMCRKPETGLGSLADQAIQEVEQQLATSADQKIHMDLSSETGHLPTDIIIKRAARFFGYLLAFMGVMAVIGLIPTVGIFVVCFMRYENSERWPLIITYAIVLVVSITFVFEHVMHVPWPPTYLGTWFPWLKNQIPSV
jgi:TctA family transporter